VLWIIPGEEGGWPTLAHVPTLEGAPSKLRLGGAFPWCHPNSRALPEQDKYSCSIRIHVELSQTRRRLWNSILRCRGD
jgi:hypothetical protein